MKFTRSLTHLFHHADPASPATAKKLSLAADVPLEELSPERPTAKEERRLSTRSTSSFLSYATVDEFPSTSPALRSPYSTSP